MMPTVRRRFRLLTLGMIVGCATAGAGAADSWTFKNKEQFVLAPSSGPSLLQQCSRDTPKTSGIYWRPDASQIKALESGLPKYLASRAAKAEAVPPQGAYRRQYVGIVQNGRRLIYGNFYGQPSVGKFDETRDPVIA